MKNLLSKGITNAKTAKNEIETYILYLAPYNQNILGKNLCPGASAGCIASCLFTAGRGKFNNVQKSRIEKANFYVKDKLGFLAQLLKELNNINKRAKKEGKKIAIRLNGTSDLDFIGQIRQNFDLDILTEFQNLIFYDYTKILGKIEKYKGQNYFLTFSRSESTTNDQIKKAIQLGANVSAVFKNELPKFYKIDNLNIQVINGDKTDIEMIFNTGKILGLKAKGQAKKDATNFVIQ